MSCEYLRPGRGTTAGRVCDEPDCGDHVLPTRLGARIAGEYLEFELPYALVSLVGDFAVGGAPVTSVGVRGVCATGDAGQMSLARVSRRQLLPGALGEFLRGKGDAEGYRRLQR